MPAPQVRSGSPESSERDRAWVERLAASDAAAFEALFRAYYAPLCDFAERCLGEAHAAEEVVQDFFLGLWVRRGRWKVRASVRAYLYVGVRNHALNVLKRRGIERRWRERAGLVIAAGDESAQPSDEVAALDDAARVRTAVAQLPERARLAVTLRWFHGLSHGEVAEVMGISIKGVERQLTRALRALKERLTS